MSITQTEALAIVDLVTMKTELRIPLSEASHDLLLSAQIHDAANFAARSTGVALADLHLLRPAIVAAVRQVYNGGQEIRETAATYAWMAPFRKIV